MSEKQAARVRQSTGHSYGSFFRDMDSEDGKTSSRGLTMTLFCSVFGAVIGTGFISGYNSAVMNNPATVIKEYFTAVKLDRTGSAFTSWELTWYWSACVATLPILAFVGCYLGSRGAQKFGRKRTIMANSILLILSGLLQALSKPAKSYEMFFLGRFVTGLQTGVATTAGTMYISEISPTEYRGAFGVAFTWFYSLGTVSSAVLGFDSLLGNGSYWPHLFTVLLVCAFIQMIVLSFCPESPRFLLIDKNDPDGSFCALTQLRGKSYATRNEIQQLTKELEATEICTEVAFSDFFKRRELRKPLMLAFASVACIQFSGISAINMYSEPIFAAVLATYGHPNTQTSQHLVAFVAFTRLTFSTFAVFLIDKVGRRTCLLVSLSGLIICNTLLAFLLSSLSTAGQLCAGISIGKFGQILTLVFIFAQSVTFCVGVSSAAIIITPELFRTNARPKASFMATSLFWTIYFLISLGFDVIQKVICGWVFLIFSASLLILFIYFWFNLPLLDGKSVNEIASYFEN